MAGLHLEMGMPIGSGGQIRFENHPDNLGGLTSAGTDKASDREFPFDNPPAEQFATTNIVQ
jgi:hypothetical protein